MGWKKLSQIKAEQLNVGCLNCSTAALIAPLDMWIVTGFGMAIVTKDGHEIYDGERDYQKNGKCKTVADIEKRARRDPNHDWRIIKHGPLHGETFQRQGKDKWVCVESNEGFA